MGTFPLEIVSWLSSESVAIGRLTVAMFHKKLTPPIPPFTHVEKLKSLLEKHMQCFRTVAAGFDKYFGDSMVSVATPAPADTKARYQLFIETGRPISRPFRSFCDHINPLLGFLDDIVAARSQACQLLDAYQVKLARVRKEESEQAIAEEGEALGKFVASVSDLYKMSNAFVIAFHTTYNPSWKQLSTEIEAVAAGFKALRAMPEPELKPTNEEIELDATIAALQAEVGSTK
jgi:hypothetical protein